MDIESETSVVSNSRPDEKSVAEISILVGNDVNVRFPTSWSSHLLGKLNQQRHSGERCDTLITLNGGFSFPAHSLILVASSPVLHSSFPSQDKASFLLPLGDTSPLTVANFLDFLYSGKMCCGATELDELQNFAETFDVQMLVEAVRIARMAVKSVDQQHNVTANRTDESATAAANLVKQQPSVTKVGDKISPRPIHIQHVHLQSSGDKEKSSSVLNSATLEKINTKKKKTVNLQKRNKKKTSSKLCGLTYSGLLSHTEDCSSPSESIRIDLTGDTDLSNNIEDQVVDDNLSLELSCENIESVHMEPIPRGILTSKKESTAKSCSMETSEVSEVLLTQETVNDTSKQIVPVQTQGDLSLILSCENIAPLVIEPIPISIKDEFCLVSGSIKTAHQ